MTKLATHKIVPPLFLMLCMLLASCSDSAAPVYLAPNVKVIKQTDHKEVEAEYQRLSYQIDSLENGVPPLILQSLPKDLPQIRSNSQKKRFFVKSILPMILLANEEIRQERDLVKNFKRQLEQGQPLEEHQQRILSKIQKRYQVPDSTGDPSKILDVLMRRVDIIPPELALAQAANESAWGTSRFSQRANNLFGEWTFTPGTGLVPEDRPEGATYEVRRFPTVFESIRSYLRNLNTHRAYTELRRLREQARSNETPLSGIHLAEGLSRYSTRGEDYVRDLQSLIRQNQMARFSKASLRLRG